MEKGSKGYSRWMVVLITVIVAALSVLLYSSGHLKRFELLSLDYRFLLNRTIPAYSTAHILPAADSAAKQAVDKKPASKDYSAFNIVMIDMPQAAAPGSEGYADIKNCVTAAKILTLWGAKSIVITDPIPEPSGTADDTEFVNTVLLSKRVYLPVLYDVNSAGGVEGVKGPWQSLMSAGAKVGHINALKDTDRRFRRVPVTMSYKGKTTYQLGLRAALDALSIKTQDLRIDPALRMIKIDVPSKGAITIPLEDDDSFLVNRGLAGKDRFPIVPFRELLESYRLIQYGARPLIVPEAFKDKICVLGTAVSGEMSAKSPVLKTDRASSAACAIIADSVIRNEFVRHFPRTIDIAIILVVSIFFGVTLTYANFLRVMMIAVIAIILFNVALIFWLPVNAALLIVIILSVPLGILLSASQLFSGLIFTVLSFFGYLAVSAGLFRATSIAIVTFYPVLAILSIFTCFYIYARFMGYLGTMRLFNLASKDGLTGLINRRYLNMMLDSELNSVTLDKSRKLSVVMCDIDNFKKLNDTHGHQAGDLILKKFAVIMKSKCRQSDIVARYGGEEFMMVFPGAGAKEALKVAEAVRQAISEENFTFKGQPYSTTMSMGLIEYTSERSKEDLIEKADQALYRAKKEGKNRVCQ